uniref:Putative tick kunitz 84 n=1 Tax=Ixodes ricinus TaxID=34613 RepID=V5IBX7_IXORI
MRAVVCFLHFGVGWIAIGTADIIRLVEENWVSCVDDPKELKCEDPGGTHYFYNRTTGNCSVGLGSQCWGSSNHFENLSQCEAWCKGAPRPPCSLDQDPGIGRASVEVWGFNVKEGNCTKFIHGNIGGNGNIFGSYKECNATCPAKKIYRTEKFEEEKS